jgi:hypothetical protein
MHADEDQRRDDGQSTERITDRDGGFIRRLGGGHRTFRHAAAPLGLETGEGIPSAEPWGGNAPAAANRP